MRCFQTYQYKEDSSALQGVLHERIARPLSRSRQKHSLRVRKTWNWYKGEIRIKYIQQASIGRTLGVDK